MNNTEHNQKTISDRARLGIAFGAAFIGILIAGLSEHPAVALSGTVQQEADAQSGPGIGLETAGGSQAGPGVSESSAAGPGADVTDPDLQPVIWYNADGIWVYSPQKDESVQLTSYAEGGAPDRMSEVYSETNPADDVVLSADGTLAAYFRRQTMSLFSGTTAELWCTDLSADQHRERKVAENVISFKILPDGSLIWMDADSGFYRLQDPVGAETPARKRIASGVTDFRVSADGADIFYVTDIGTGYALASSEGASSRRIAESVYGIEWASEDLDTIYYNNGDGDMFCINGLRNVQIVDVDIQDFAVIEKTGHLYYLRADEGTKEGETAEESTADDAGAESGEETGTLTAEEEILNLINSIKLENGLTIAEAAESAAAESEAEKAKEDHWETVLPDSRKGRLGYFDGQNHGIVLSGVASINTMNSDSIEQDRLLVTLDLDNDYRIFILRDDVPLDTGMKITDDGLTDLCIDFARDTLYYIRQSEDEAGSMDRGTVYARDFDEKGFGTERKLFDGATASALPGTERSIPVPSLTLNLVPVLRWTARWSRNTSPPSGGMKAASAIPSASTVMFSRIFIMYPASSMRRWTTERSGALPTMCGNAMPSMTAATPSSRTTTKNFRPGRFSTGTVTVSTSRSWSAEMLPARRRERTSKGVFGTVICCS